MIQPIFRCSVDGKTKYLTEEEFKEALKHAKYKKYCVMGEQCGIRMSNDPEPIKEEGVKGGT